MKKLLKPIVFFLIPIALVCCKNEGINGEKSDLTVEDACGNTYTTVKIGETVWTAENLRADKDVQGNPIAADTMMFNPNKDEANVQTYGKLYTWDAAQNVCPEGWRLPDKDEAKAMINLLGDAAGAKLAGNQNLWKNIAEGKESAPEHFGEGLFNAVPAGYFYNGEYYGYQYNTSFWTSSLDDSEDASKLSDDQKKVYCITLSYSDAKAGAVDRNFAMSVRCIQDKK